MMLISDKIDSGCMLLFWQKREPWARRWDLQNEWIGGIRESGGCQLLLPLFVQMFPDHCCRHLHPLQWLPSPDCFLSTPMWSSSLRELWEQLTSSTIHSSPPYFAPRSSAHRMNYRNKNLRQFFFRRRRHKFLKNTAKNLCTFCVISFSDTENLRT